MYAPGRSSTKKEGDLRGEGWDCNRVKKKEERVLGTQTEKKDKHVGNTYGVPSRPTILLKARGRNAGAQKIFDRNTTRSWMYARGRSSSKKERDLRREGWG